jgi:hypothetical protein
MKTIDNLKVGDVVWYMDVNSNRMAGPWPKQTVVTKVGSKLITTEDYVFRKDTGKTNDMYQRQWLIVDKNKYEDDQRTSKIIRHIRNEVSSSDVSLTNAIAASKLLGVYEDWMESQAYQQGVKDYWNYAAISDNPFDKEKLEHSEWEDGFTDARAVDNSDTEEEEE